MDEVQDVDVVAQLADLKEVDYHNTLLISTLVELLIEKRIINREELLSVMKELDEEMLIKAEDDTWKDLGPSRG